MKKNILYIYLRSSFSTRFMKIQLILRPPETIKLFPWSVQARSSLTLERDGRVVTLPEVSSQEQKIMLLPRSLPVSADIEFIPVSNNVVYQSSKNVDTLESM
jgi:hypothetical protein